ncbi:MAG: large subunit ribosomal protein L7/L12 [Flavobacteriaceae bacterium]|jgi:large subunit ribosomal protein L7/L12
MTDENTTQDAVEETITEATEAPVVEEAKVEEVKEEAKVEEVEEEGADVEVPAQFKALVEQVESMTVLELNELVKLLEKKFGVSASAVAVAGPAAGDAGEEKTEFDVELTSDGGAKIPVMKVVKEVLGLGLKEAKDLVEGTPAMIKTGIKKEEAEEIKAKIEAAGGKVELK